MLPSLAVNDGVRMGVEATRPKSSFSRVAFKFLRRLDFIGEGEGGEEVAFLFKLKVEETLSDRVGYVLESQWTSRPLSFAGGSDFRPEFLCVVTTAPWTPGDLENHGRWFPPTTITSFGMDLMLESCCCEEDSLTWTIFRACGWIMSVDAWRRCRQPLETVMRSVEDLPA
ncbi:hypothetical protein AAG570_010573 [Ranatra chinensis]|uniref:Uncharacterized protein n=1 Tax=Ranatra chinensis TaxID=642074 RepID=A0ABD0YNE3_9HEMI